MSQEEVKKEVQGRGFWWHWQNLKEDSPKAWLHGRAWLHHRPDGVFGVSWCAPSHDVHVEAIIGGHQQLQLSVSCGLFALYFTFEQWSWLRKWKVCEGWPGKELSLSIHDWAIWWNLWTNEDEWNAKTPKWRNGCFHIDDFVLGKYTYTKVNQPSIPVLIPMPEKDYEGTLTFFTQTWKRSRWPFSRQRQGASVDIEGGIPIPGKGETDYNCDDTACFSIGTSATTIVGAIDAVVQRVNERREHYGGKGWLPQEVAQ
jgi:hypothetical protein